jgi:hypothetical protein
MGQAPRCGPDGSTLILAHTRADVRDLNERVRHVLKERGQLGTEVSVTITREVGQSDGSIVVERSERILAHGDRVMFLKNSRDLGVKNGSLGTVTEIAADAIVVRLDGKARKEIEFRLTDYSALDYGYAATIHKAQGATVEQSFVLATPGMDRHLAYVAMTRHREQAEIYASREDFSDFDTLKNRLSRERMKDTTLDYADRRGLYVLDDKAGREEMQSSDRDLNRALQSRPAGIYPNCRASGSWSGSQGSRGRVACRDENTAAEIASSAVELQKADRAGIGGQVRDFVRRAERERSLSKGQGLEKEDGLER